MILFLILLIVMVLIHMDLQIYSNENFLTFMGRLFLAFLILVLILVVRGMIAAA